MTIATKNGVPIVKDGVIASNCGCCGGWYCCDDRLFDRQCRVSSLGALVGISVTIDAQDYKRVAKFVGQCFHNGVFQHETGTQTVEMLFGSMLSGTFSLAPQFLSGEPYTNNNKATWRYSYEPPTNDAVGCGGYVIYVDVVSECVSVGGVLGKRLRITQAYGYTPTYEWYKSKSGEPPNDTVTASDMACTSSTSGTFPCPDPNAVRIVKGRTPGRPFPVVIAGQSYEDIIIPGPCRPSQTTWSRQYQGLLKTGTLGGLPQEVLEEGSGIMTATTTVTLLQ